VVVSDTANAPLFLTGNVDWYVSNGSVLWAANSVSTNGVVYHGGTRYIPLTNGTRTDCFERFIVTLAPRYEEVLPDIPNPPSPWRHITGTRLWRAHGAVDREQDRRYWEEVHRYGMTQMVVTDHETMLRDGGESFTFRTKAAPGKGRRPAPAITPASCRTRSGLCTAVQQLHRLRAGQRVSGTPTWCRATRRTTPARLDALLRAQATWAVEYCARLAPQNQEKFRFSTAYCDVHTAVAPWAPRDYDPRVPGAGTFAAVFLRLRRDHVAPEESLAWPRLFRRQLSLLLHGPHRRQLRQTKLTSREIRAGRFRPAQDARPGCNFGMGNPDMFFASQRGWMNDTNCSTVFLAATVALGTPAFSSWKAAWGTRSAAITCSSNSTAATASPTLAEIRYVTADGRLLKHQPGGATASSNAPRS
jgi:hypothetical protein